MMGFAEQHKIQPGYMQGFLLASLLLLSLNSNRAVAIEQCSSLWPYAVQNTQNSSVDGKIVIETQVQIKDSPDNKVATEDLTDNASNSCVSVSCSADASNIPPDVTFTDFPGGAELTIGSNQTLSPGDYKKIKIEEKKKLTLTAGDYTFSESFEMEKKAQIIVSGTGTVRIYVQTSATVGEEAKLNNGGSPSAFFLFSNESLDIVKKAKIKGFYYGRKDLTVGEDVQITGAIASAGTITLNKKAKVTYDSAGLDDGGDFCNSEEFLANDDTGTTNQGGSTTVDLAANDSGGLDLSTVAIVSGPSNGSLVNNGNGTVDYTHNGGASTSDSFTYTIDDQSGNTSNVATVSISISVPADCNAVFPGTIQTHGAGGFIRVHEKGSYSESQILNSGTVISTGSIVDHDNASNPGRLYCDSSSSTLCTASGTPATAHSVSIAANTSSTDVSSSGTLGNAGNNNYRDISIGNSGNLAFSNSYSEYFIRNMNLGDDASLTLAPGTYWIEGDWTMGKRSSLAISPVGVVQIFVGDQVEFSDDSQINTSGSVGNLLIYSNASGGSKFKIKKKSVAKGYFYTQGSFEFKEESSLTGGLSGFSIDHIDHGSVLTYEMAAVDFPQFCQSSGSAADHYAISFDGGASNNDVTSVTCEPASVTITAHDASHVDVTPSGISINLQTSSAQGTWSAPDVGSVVDNGGGNADYSFTGSDSQITLQLNHAAVAVVNINIATNAEQEDPDLTLVDAAFKFYGDGVVDSIGTQLAGKDSNTGTGAQTITLRAIQTDPATGQCSALVGAGGVAIGLGYECNNPSSCKLSNDLQITDMTTAITESIAGVNNGAAKDYSVTPTLTFDASGTATFKLNYADVGQVSLHASATLDADGAGSGTATVDVLGSSNGFVVKPYDLVVSSLPGNPATTSAGAGFKAAGESFQVSVEARQSSGAITPNFGRETTAESVVVNFDSLVFPVGGVNGSVTAGTFSLTGTDGELSASDVSWSEVGSLKLSAAIADGNYLGAGDVTGTVSGTVGRFYPNEFQLASSSLANSCGAFSYMQQNDIDLAYTLEAHKVGGGVVANYDNTDLGYPATLATLVAENNNDGTDLTARLTVGIVSWDDGLMTLADTTAQFDRSAGLDGPYASLGIGVRLNDGDGANFDSLDFNAATASCVVDVDCDARELAGSLNLRHGRLFLQDVHGPESVVLSVPFRSEYWDNNRWLFNSDDSCTQLPNTAIELDAEAISVNRTVNVDAAGGDDTTGSFGIGNVNNPAATVNLAGGDAELFFSVPNVQGDFPVDVDLLAFPWLRFDWDQNNNHSDDTSVPSATVTYGRYRGHDRVIYWQERLQ